jgi:protein arginine kinase activator
LNKILANLLTNDPTFSGMGLAFKSERCENCGLTYSQFAQGGKLGCSNCYEVFKDKLNPLIRRIHSSERHKGKVPARTGGKLRLIKEIESLKTELGNLVKNEEFEKAAEVRDRIKDLEKRLAD